MQESRQSQVFRSRCEYLLQHVQVVEVALGLVQSAITEGTFNLPEENRENAIFSDALSLNAGTYQRLGVLPTKQWGRTLHIHSRRRNYEFALGELYAYFDEYVRTIVEALPVSASRYPKSASEGIELSSHSVQKLISSEISIDHAVGECIVTAIKAKKFGKGMADEMGKLLGINIDPKTRHFAHFVLDVRNSLIHNGGKVSKTLVKEYGKLLTKELDTKEGKTIKLNYDFIVNGVVRIQDYVKHLDKLLVPNYIKLRNTKL